MITDEPFCRRTYYLEGNHCKQFIEVYEETTHAAQESGCRIGGTKLYISSLECAHRNPEIQAMMRYFLLSLSKTLSFELSLELDETNRPREYLVYDHNTGELDLSGLSFDEDIDTFPDVETNRMLTRLLERPMIQLRLINCQYYELPMLGVCWGLALERLTLDLVCLYTEHFNADLWSSVLAQLSLKTRLRRLEMYQCQYENTPDEDHMLFQLPSGLYPVNPDFQGNFNFFLAPSGDIEEVIILTDETSISPQLMVLADQVARFEVDKIAQIEGEGYVRDQIVGFHEDPQPKEVGIPGEDGVSGEVEHDGIQDGEDGEIVDSHSEHSENDNHDDLEYTS
jgi:hypothetical protein